MPRRVKEGEKVEMIIRDLLKEEDNRRCINCNNLGPQYVCTTFWTFVCTNCSGVHREFNHRVKSVSAAKFNEEEITALQAGGNERAKQIYFKTWDPELNAYPDTSNLQRLREFVNHVYIDRRYSGDNNSNKLSMIKLDSRRNSCEWPSEKPGWGRRDDFFQRSSLDRTGKSGRDDYSSFEKSSSYENKKVLSLKDLLEERSPRHTQETPISSSLRRRSTHIEIVDDRFREDGSVKTYERNSRRESRGGSMSPGSQSSRTMSLPAVRPVSVILGEKVSELRIEGPPRPSGGKNAESSARVEKAATIPGPSEKQNNAANSSSLIDFFDTESDLPSSTAQPQAQPKASNESSSIASSSNQASASIPNLLLDWSSPVASPSKAPETSNSFGALAITSTNNDQPFCSNIRNPIEQEIQMHQLPYKQQSHTFASSPGNTYVESSPDQHWNKSPPPNDITPVRSASLEQPSHAANSEGSRKEIPQGLCTSKFTPFNSSVAGWPIHPSQGAGYGMQFHPPAMSVAVSPNPPKPRNPFDIGDNTFQVQEATFPSISPLQGAPQTMPTSTALESHPSLYATALPSQPHVSPYGMNMPLVPGAWGQLSNNMPLTRPQGNVGRTEDALAPLNPIQQTHGTDSVPAGPTSQLPQVGNPFG